MQVQLAPESEDHIVAGIDVGSTRKGFHAVALIDGAYYGHTISSDADLIAAWCNDLGARAVGIDAPCCWSRDGRARTAERDLMTKRISCFSTPTLEKAQTHPKNYFGWMINGARLYAALRPHYPLFDGTNVNEPVCFETFPHAIAFELSGEIVRKCDKTRRRRALLESAGITTTHLTNADLRDAALCALAAHSLVHGRFIQYGHSHDGLLIVPRRQ